MHDSGIFEYTWKELEFWLEHLDNTAEGKKEGVIQFLEKVICMLISQPNGAKDSISGNLLLLLFIEKKCFKES